MAKGYIAVDGQSHAKHEESKVTRTFHIGFHALVGGTNTMIGDDRQFEVEDSGDLSSMMTELVMLFNAYCVKNYLKNAKIDYIEEATV